MRQQRQQSVNSFDLSTAVEAQANEISALRGMVSTLMGADSPVTATVQAIATDMTQRTMNLMSAATANDQRLDGVTGSLDSLTSSVGGQLAAAAATNAAAQAEMAATLTATAQSSEDETPSALLLLSADETRSCLRHWPAPSPPPATASPTKVAMIRLQLAIYKEASYSTSGSDVALFPSQWLPPCRL